jgi:hypothetical protein
MTDNQLYKDFDYIQGQITALQALIMGLAQNIPKDTFREQSLERLEIAKNNLIYSDHEGADTQLKAIYHCEQWVKIVTD